MNANLDAIDFRKTAADDIRLAFAIFSFGTALVAARASPPAADLQPLSSK